MYELDFDPNEMLKEEGSSSGKPFTELYDIGEEVSH